MPSPTCSTRRWCGLPCAASGRRTSRRRWPPFRMGPTTTSMTPRCGAFCAYAKATLSARRQTKPKKKTTRRERRGNIIELRMAVKSCDLAIYQGDDWSASVTVLRGDLTPADLTGYTATSQIRAGVADQAPMVAAVIQATIVLPNFVSLYLPHAQSVLLPGSDYRWDVQLVSPSGQITTILAGEVLVTQEVTRA